MKKKSIYPEKKKELNHRLLDSQVWNDFKFRKDDIIINSYQKAGTTWVQQIVAQLLWNGSGNIKLSGVSPWIDCRFPSREERLAVVEAQTHRRFLKSHLPVESLVFSKQAKYIYSARDGRDVLWSIYNHHCKLKKDVIVSIDNIPGNTGPPIGFVPPSVVAYFQDWLEKDGYPWWSFWDHIRSWWEIKDLPNVLLVHFSNLKENLSAEIRRIAGFLSIPIDESQWKIILSHCSFHYMKKHASGVVPFAGELWEGGAVSFMHSGINGRWKDILTPSDIENYEVMAKEKLGKECAYWLETGRTIVG